MQPIMNLLIGTGVLYMALFTPFALFRLFAFVDPSTDAGASFREWLRGLGVNSYGDPLAGQGNPAARFEANQLTSAVPGVADVFPGLRSGTRGQTSGGSSGDGVEDVHEQRFDEQSATDESGSRPGSDAMASPPAEQAGSAATDAATEAAATESGVPAEAVQPVVDAAQSAAGAATDAATEAAATESGVPAEAVQPVVDAAQSAAGAANQGPVVASSIDDVDSGSRQRAARAAAADSETPTVPPPGSESTAAGEFDVEPDAGPPDSGTADEVDPPGSDAQPGESS